MSKNSTRMQTLVIGVTLLSVTLLLSSCYMTRVRQHYEGNPIPDSEVAIIDSGSSWSDYGTIYKIDGKRFFDMELLKGGGCLAPVSIEGKYKVKPGTYNVELVLGLPNPGWSEYATVYIGHIGYKTQLFLIEVEKGHTYRIRRTQEDPFTWSEAHPEGPQHLELLESSSPYTARHGRRLVVVTFIFEDLCHPSRKAVELKQGEVNRIEE